MLVHRFSRNLHAMKMAPRFFSSTSVDTRPQFLIEEANGFLPRKVTFTDLQSSFSNCLSLF
jgi:hypothetical protein